MNKKIQVTITNDAKIVLETEGFKGEVCVNEIKKILSGFTQNESIEHTSDYYDKDEGLDLYAEVKQ